MTTSDWIAVAALALSAVVLYLEHLRAFALSVQLAGRISVTRNPLDISEAALVLDVLFQNVGARSGTIETVGVTVTSEDFAGAFVAHLEFEKRTVPFGEVLAQPELLPFIAFELDKRRTLPKRLLFRHSKNGTAVLPAGDYEGELWVWASSKRRWSLEAHLGFEVTPEDVAEINDIRAQRLPNGRFFVNWKTRDKLIPEWERRADALAEELP